jgi:ElaB/YqjD/DUF883 family membrane-anchored ribosome-binding protein
MSATPANGQPVASPCASERKWLCAGKGFWCFNPMANRRQAALEAEVEDLNSKLEDSMKSQGALSDQLLDALRKNNALEKEMTMVQAENDDLRKAGVSFRRTAAWKVKEFSTRGSDLFSASGPPRHVPLIS